MDLKPFFEKVEDAIQTIGVDPEITRCEGEGQWLLNRGEIEVYIDIWQPEQHQQWEYFKDDEPAAIFQVLAPVCILPDDESKHKDIYEELLEMNFNMFYSSFTVNMDQKMIALRFRRLVEGLNRVEMIEPIESIGFYAESILPYFVEKYGAKKIHSFS